ncbi:hypothetical protein ASPBRDRAFT_43472 [Aspergillus brasiliensis CBS 101740]|uniref:Uncharacterized protein n=1 Tax=Aspergillus brasiliensis (strain CBS 101740 / IMI 381727 / IBT 21946) TaxID=767769 RepID=A0A1L9UK51_ASPBC|nr:hypothetical protein ASPBRDRAFT_43472 [Aspergillus brasiliensis CBS 101740]
MVVPFCDDCGNLLDESPNDTLQCELCGKTAKNMAMHHAQVSTLENLTSETQEQVEIQYARGDIQDDWEGSLDRHGVC